MEKRREVAPTNVCPACGARFVCGMDAGEARCWCAALPPLPVVPADKETARCYCPDCLRKRVEEARTP